MHNAMAMLVELQIDSGGLVQPRLECERSLIPQAGQYTLAFAPDDGTASLAVPLFLAEQSAESGFWAAPHGLASWQPGTALQLRGPLGNGFHPPEAARRVALAAMDSTPARLLPLLAWAQAHSAAVALWTDAPPTRLPAFVELAPLGDLPNALQWADFLALDLSLRRLPELRAVLGLAGDQRCPTPGQALIFTDMPCGSQAQCGACAAPTRRGWKLACKHGPVFDLQELLV